ncbi:MAG: glycosyltransferase family 4 protein [Coriobacteriia bacterium]
MPRSHAETFGVNVVGFLSGTFGLAVAARNTVHMLGACSVPAALTDVILGTATLAPPTYTPPANVAGQTPYPLTIFHVNPMELEAALTAHPLLSKDDRVNAMVPFWELPRLPDRWLPVMRAMDIILAPTLFVLDAVRQALPDSVCIHYRQAVFLPEGIAANRPTFDIPDDTFTFVSSFDVGSDIERKNPLAVVDAFRKAFPNRRDVTLVLKLNCSSAARSLFTERIDTLTRIADDDERIIIIDRELNYSDVLSLYASSDVLVSLHRSEGLGLALMEAMTLGKAVIATGWSGNMDFCTEENSCLVGYDLIPVVSQHPSYAPEFIGDVRWADPRVDEAVEQMRRLAGDRELTSRLGAQGQRDMAALRCAHESGEVITALRRAIEPHAPLWEQHSARRAQLQHIANGGVYRRARRLAARLLRWLRLR